MMSEDGNWNVRCVAGHRLGEPNSAMKRRAEYLRTLAEEEESRAIAAIRDGDSAGADDALQRAQRLRRIAYLRATAAAYQGDPALNPEQDQPRDHDLAGK